MPNGSKNLLILAGISCLIVFLLVFNLFFSSFVGLWQRTKKIPTVSPTPTPLILSSPVESKFMESASEILAKSDHLVLSLPEEKPIYAVFDGTVSIISHNKDFENIQITDNKGLIASYLISGEIVVEQGKQVKKGEVIARIKEGKGPGCLGGKNLGLYLFKDEKLLKLTPEMLGISGL